MLEGAILMGRFTVRQQALNLKCPARYQLEFVATISGIRLTKSDEDLQRIYKGRPSASPAVPGAPLRADRPAPPAEPVMVYTGEARTWQPALAND
jgi:hypothetical protein